MSDIDFQNGFICGMATKGLVRSGELYRPIIWNDDGVYGYFYIDFRREVTLFSTEMWNESVVVHDSVQIKATDVIDQTGGIYKIVCDISDRPHGITVMNKKTSRLRFASGEAIPVFSVHMFIAGQDAYIDGGYVYERQVDQEILLLSTIGTVAEISTFEAWENQYMDAIIESYIFVADYFASTAENASVSLT